MTTRSSGVGLQFGTTTETVTDGYGNLAMTNVYGCSIPNWEYRHVGVDTPHYHARRRRGELLPINTFDSYEGGFLYADGGWMLRRVSDNWTWQANGPLPSSYNYPYKASSAMIASWLSTVDFNDLAVAATAKLGSDFDALTFVVETYREVPQMLEGAATRFFEMCRDPTLKKFNNGWMETRYGWRPLYNDMKNIYELLTDPGRYSDFHRASVRSGNSFQEYQQIPLSYGSWAGTLLMDYKATLSSRGYAITKMVPPRVSVNPVITGWELVPYSFVVDWFYTVGQSLKGLAAYTAMPDLICGAGYKLDVITSATCRGYGTNGFDGYVDYTTLHQESFVKRLGVVPDFRPIVRIKLDLDKFRDILAMASQTLGERTWRR